MEKSTGEIVLGVLAVANAAIMGYFGYSVQQTQTGIQRGQLDLAATAASSQEKMAQNKLAADLIPYLLSQETRQRETALRLLNRTVPPALYSEIYASVAITDPNLVIRLQAIKQLGRSQDKNAIQPLRAIENDTKRSPEERDSAKQSSASVNANYEAIKACDLNGDGRVDVNDYQIATNQVLAGLPCAPAWGKKKCRIQDIQSITNAILGRPCAISP